MTNITKGREGDFGADCAGGPLDGSYLRRSNSVHPVRLATQEGEYIFIEKHNRVWWQWFAY